MKRILYLTNIPSPYRVEFFNELSKYCDVTVVFEMEEAVDRNEKWRSSENYQFHAKFLKISRGGGMVYLKVIHFLKEYRNDTIVVGGYSTFTGMVSILYMKAHRIPFILNSDGGLIKNDSYFKKKIKKFFIGSANSWLSTGSVTDQYLLHYGAKKDQIFHYPFTSVKEKDLDVPTKAEKEEIKKRLGIMESKVVLFVGSFIPRKGVDTLLKACKKMTDTAVILAGGKELSCYQDILGEEILCKIYVAGFLEKEEVHQYYRAADLFVLPTREDIWGLVVNEAMACGLPVITTTRCVAGRELVQEGRNGYLVEPEDVETLRERIESVILHPEKAEKMGRMGFQRIQRYTIERMAEEHMRIFKKKTLIFLGYAIPEIEVEEATGISYAGNKMQLHIIKELSGYEDLNIKGITIYPCASYPHDHKLFYFRRQMELQSEVFFVAVRFLNLPIIKQLCQIWGTYVEVKRMLRRYQGAEILAFNMYPQVGTPLWWLKKSRRTTIVTAILADLPIDIDNRRQGLSRIVRKWFDEQTKRNIRGLDKAIVLNNVAAERYLQGQKYIVVEGGIPNEGVDTVGRRIRYCKRKREILYAGTLVEYNGIKILLEVMKRVQSDVVLKVYGDGPLKEEVERAAGENSKISYMGKISNEKMLLLQKEAYLLINLRPVHDPIAEVTFPSKIFEYLLSGTAILSTKLNAFTPEYWDKMFFFENEDLDMMAKKIDEVMGKSFAEMEAMAQKAYEFVTKEKNWAVQGKKIYDFIAE